MATSGACHAQCVALPLQLTFKRCNPSTSTMILLQLALLAILSYYMEAAISDNYSTLFKIQDPSG